MTFTVKETIGGLNHLRLKWERRFLGRTKSYYIDKLSVDQKCEYVLGVDGKPVECPICGYVIARLHLPGGWILETCSSTGLKALIGNRKFRQWCQALCPRHVESANQGDDQLPTC